MNVSLSIYEEKIKNNWKKIENYYSEQVRDYNMKNLQIIKTYLHILNDVEITFNKKCFSKIYFIFLNLVILIYKFY